MRQTVKKIKSALIIAVAVVCMLLVLMVFFVDMVQKSMWSNTAKNVMQLTVQSSEMLKKNLDFEIESLLELSDLIKENKQDAFSFMEIYQRRHHFANLAVVDKQGNGYYADKTPVSVTGLAWYQQALQGEIAVSQPFYGLDKLSKITIQVPMMARNEINGAVYASCPAENFYDSYALSFYDGRGYSCVIQNNGDFVFAADKFEQEKGKESNLFTLLERENGGTQQLDSFRGGIGRNQQGETVLAYAGQPTYFCYAPLNNLTGWYTVSMVPARVIYRQANKIVLFTMMICGFILLSAVVIIWLVYWSIRKYNKRLEEITYTDPVTKCSNFEKFKLDVRTLFAKNPGTPYAIIYSDIKNFKYINDVYGFEAGDRVLKHYIECLAHNGKKEAYTRVSGDTFLSVISYKTKEEITSHCEKVLTKVCDISEVVPGAAKLIVYTGIYCTDGNNQEISLENMIDRANIALKNAKKKLSTNFAFYDEQARSSMLEEQNMENHMEDALRNGQFLVYLQPKVDIQNNRVAGAEALVRWNVPGRGLIPPGKFVPLFEKNGFIQRLDTYMFASVCEILRQWIDGGGNVVPVSINVSKAQLNNERFLKQYIQIKENYRIPDNLLEIEFTESLVVGNNKKMEQVIGVFHQHGIRCSIDDFGSGYSSLNSLKDLSIDIFKIDKGFFDQSKDSEKARIVVENVINLGKELKIQTVAEGVELPEQVEFLKRIGGEMVQGFVFAAPMPVAEFEQNYIQVRDAQPVG